jgi:hypothetical protein
LEFISPESLQVYQRRKLAEEEKEAAAKEQEREEPSYTSLPPPPTPPAHLFMIHHSPPTNHLLNTHDTELPVVLEEEEEDDGVDIDDEEGEEIYNSTESPMDIVDDYDDVEDMSLNDILIDDLPCNDEDEDQVIPYIDIHPIVEEEEEDEIMTDNHHDGEVEEEVTEKAQHVYLSKIPAHHVVVNSSVPVIKQEGVSSPPLDHTTAAPTTATATANNDA